MGASASMGTSAITSASSAYAQATAAKAAAGFAASQHEENAKLAGFEGATAKSIGDINASSAIKTGRAQEAEQRADAAATGVNVNFGSAAQLQEDTGYQARMNALTIKNNALRQAFGYQVAAINDQGQANMTRIAGQNKYTNTLLTGGMNALSYGAKGYGAYTANNGNFANPSGDGSFTSATDGLSNDYTMPGFGRP